MRPPLKALWTAAGLLAAVPVLYPIANPDLYWHLSAGRWILEHGTLPRADFLSFSAAGRPWVDFEWLSQLAFAAAGLERLCLLKAVLLAASAFILDRTLARRGCGPALRLAGLALWSAGLLTGADIRPDLFSLLFLGLLVYAGENGLLKRPTLPRLALLSVMFVLWPELHGGFPLGWAALLCYALAGGSWLPLLLCVPATLLNPYGWGPWKVVLLHGGQSADLGRVIAEWKPLGFTNPVYLPVWGLLVLTAFAVCFALAARLHRGLKKHPSWPLLALTGALGLMSLRHERGCAYFAVCASALLPLLARDMGWEDAVWTRRLTGLWCLSYAMFLGWLLPKVPWGTLPFAGSMPGSAVEFMAKERQTIEPLRLYNQWEWGGYLGWRLRPWYKVFWDGRYIFQGELAEAERAVRGPQDWQAFMRAKGLDGALMPDLPLMLPAQKRYRDGTIKDFPRPWHVFYMPRDRWALVYWDAKALLFVDRAKVPKAWLAAHEYRYVRPHDDAALAEALRLKEVPAAAMAAEQKRHEAELEALGARLQP